MFFNGALGRSVISVHSRFAGSKGSCGSSARAIGPGLITPERPRDFCPGAVGQVRPEATGNDVRLPKGIKVKDLRLGNGEVAIKGRIALIQYDCFLSNTTAFCPAGRSAVVRATGLIRLSFGPASEVCPAIEMASWGCLLAAFGA